MRVIKFRAWDEKNKKMWYSSKVGNSIKDENNNEWTFTIYFDEEGNLHAVIYTLLDYGFSKKDTKEIELPVMQYTGVKDYNGREIYEGDIIEIPDKNFRAVVVFFEGCFAVEIIGQGKDYSKCFCLRDLAATSPLAVIGNIWENPELLESEVEHNA